MRKIYIILMLAALASITTWLTRVHGTTSASAKKDIMEIATFGAGCFWGVEATFQQLPGVTATRVGYAGGATAQPSYEQVCSGATGHTEVVEVTYDPAKISYDTLLDTFFAAHDAAGKEKAQYQSVIFYHTPAQHTQAVAALGRLAEHGVQAVTKVLPAPTFYEAEAYHPNTITRSGGSPMAPAARNRAPAAPACVALCRWKRRPAPIPRIRGRC